MKNHFDMLVIGAGSGGLAVSQKAASYGAKVALVEMKYLGGTCVNFGCIPKKIMWNAGQIADYNDISSDYGFREKYFTLDFEVLVNNRDKFIQTLHKIYQQRLQKNNIHYIQGIAKFINSNVIEINNTLYTATHIVISTGGHPIKPKMEGAEFAIDSDGFFSLKKQPKKVAIIGAGYIAVELASILNQLGSEVKLVIRHDKLLRSFDHMLSDSLTEIMANKGIQIFKQRQVRKITQEHDNQLIIHCDDNKLVKNLDCVIFAIGRVPCTSLLNLSATNVDLDKSGFIKTDKWETTNVPHIYALGDVTGKKLLTPVAVSAGRRLAERIIGGKTESYLDYENIPTVVFNHPPIGSVGLSEKDALDKYGKNQIKVYHTEFNSLLYALGERKMMSRMKLIALKDSEKIIGCHLICSGADEILQGFAVAIKMGATKSDFDKTIAIHPTNAEELVTM